MTTSMRALSAVASLLAAGSSIPTCLNVYHSDIERICDAEHRSGLTVKADAAGLQAWLQHSIASPEGVVLLNQLQAESPRDRAVQLRTEARTQSLATCPLADSFEALAKDDEYKTAIANLCAGEAVSSQGNVARLDVVSASDADRMSEIAAWTAENSKSPEAQSFVSRLAGSSVKDRGGILRGEAAKLGMTTCPLASVLDQPPPASTSVPVVSLPYFTVASVDPPRLRSFISEGFTNGPVSQIVNYCYGPALAKQPGLAGSVVLRVVVDGGKGKLSKVEDVASPLGNAGVVKCLVSGLTGASVLTVTNKENVASGPLKCTVSLALSPTKGLAPTGWPSFAFPAPVPELSAPTGGPDAGAPDAGKKKKGR
jgi:hypothetical protein